MIQISNEDLLQISIKIEREGQVFYNELAKYISDREVQNFLKFMAREEANHEAQFKKMLEEMGDQPLEWQENAELCEMIETQFQTDLFPRLNEIMDHKSRFEGVQQALDSAMESERISAEFYRILCEECEDIESKTLLTMLQKAELEHYEYIKKIRGHFEDGTASLD